MKKIINFTVMTFAGFLIKNIRAHLEAHCESPLMEQTYTETSA